MQTHQGGLVPTSYSRMSRLRIRRFFTAVFIVCFSVSLSACQSSETPRSSSVDVQELSPVELVSLYFIASRENDSELFQSLLAEEYVGDGNPLNYGLESLTVLDLYEKTGSDLKRHLEAILAGSKAQELNVQREDIAVVGAKYDVQYDGTKVPMMSGIIEWSFVLYRHGNDSPWKISNWGVGYGGL